MVRDKAETHLSAIISDLIRTIEDLAVVGVGKRETTASEYDANLFKADQGKSLYDSHYKTRITDRICALARVESARSAIGTPNNRQRGFDSQPTASEMLDAPRIQAASGGIQQSLIWSKLLQKIREIEKQWCGARTDIRKRVGSSALEVSSTYHFDADINGPCDWSTSMYVSDSLGGLGLLPSNPGCDASLNSSSHSEIRSNSLRCPSVVNVSQMHKLRQSLFYLSEKLFALLSPQAVENTSSSSSSPYRIVSDLHDLAFIASDILLSTASLGIFAQDSSTHSSAGLTGLEELITLVGIAGHLHLFYVEDVVLRFSSSMLLTFDV